MQSQLKQKLISKSKESENLRKVSFSSSTFTQFVYDEKIEVLQKQLKTAKKDLEYFKQMHAFHHKLLVPFEYVVYLVKFCESDIEQVKNPDLNNMQSRRIKGLTKEVEVLTKRLSERTNEKV